MDATRPESLFRSLAGKLQDAVGGLGGNTAAQARSQAEQAVGQAQDVYGEMLDHVERVATSRPLATVAVAAGAGFVAGLLFARR